MIFFRKNENDDSDIQHRMLNVILSVSIVGVAIACIVGFIMHQPLPAQLLTTCCLVLFLLIYLVANVFNYFQISVIFFSILFNNILLPCLFVFAGGIESGMPIWCLLGFVLPFLLIRGKKVFFMFALNFIEFLGVVLYTYFHPESVYRMGSYVVVLSDVVISMFVGVVVISVIFRYQTKTYEKQQEAIKKAINDANSAIKQKREFISNVSHDIRTPMDSIIGFTELAKKNIDNPEKLADSLSKISRSSKHLLNLVNEVLDTSKIESGKIMIEEELGSLHSVIDEICQIMQPDIEKKNITIETDYSMLDDDVLSFDKVRLNQILMNVFSNAVKYSYEGGKIYISIIQLSSDDETKVINEFHIRDEGCGMSPEFLEHIFEPFARDRNASYNVDGTGLGLTIAKSLTEILGGYVEVDSELGKGTEFTVVLPLSIPSLTDMEEDQETLVYDFTGRRVLVVDDNDLNREIIVDSLRDEGFIVDEAIDGSFAIEKLRDSEPGFYELVIMDLQMPVMDGYETARIIRKFSDKEVAEIPIVAITAETFPENKSKAFNVGMNAYLVKPVEMPSLLKVLMLFLRENKRS